LCDNIFYFAELGMQEFETSGLMMELLEKAGFSIEKNLSGMPTGFVATYGSGKPVVALHTEFDATPASSQKAGVIEHPIVTARRAIPKAITSTAR
jgi:aminobenzoyl-glutamate utilization protein B